MRRPRDIKTPSRAIVPDARALALAVRMHKMPFLRGRFLLALHIRSKRVAPARAKGNNSRNYFTFAAAFADERVYYCIFFYWNQLFIQLVQQ